MKTEQILMHKTELYLVMKGLSAPGRTRMSLLR